MALEAAILRWIGDSGGRGGHQGDSYIRRITYNWTEINTLFTEMNSHTLCNRGAVIRTTFTSFAGSPPGSSVNIDERAILYFRDPDTLEILHFSYPSPIPADLETYPSGIRVKDSAVATIVGYISVLNSKSYIPLYGLYYQKV